MQPVKVRPSDLSHWIHRGINICAWCEEGFEVGEKVYISAHGRRHSKRYHKVCLEGLLH